MARFRATPYIKALFDAAGDATAAEALVEPLEQVAAVVREVPDFREAMESPLVSPDVKSAILSRVLDHLEVPVFVRRLIEVVQSHYRLQHLEDIASGFRALVDRSLGRVHARVEVASPLDPEGRNELVDALENAVGTDVVADFVETPELLGGFRIQVGSKLFDGSLAGQLNQLGRGAL